MSYRQEKVVATYQVEKFSPFDYESFEFGGIYYATTPQPGEYVEEAFERIQLEVQGFANVQFNVKRALFLKHRGWAQMPDTMPALPTSPVIFTHPVNSDEMEDEFLDDDDDPDSDRAFAPKRTLDAGSKLTVSYGIESFSPFKEGPRKYDKLQVGGQFYTTYVGRKETALDAYERAWRVLEQVAERQFIVKCRSFHREQIQEPMLSTGAIINQKYLRG